MSDPHIQIKVGLESIAHIAEAGALSPSEWDALARLAALVTEDEFVAAVKSCDFHDLDEAHMMDSIKRTFEYYMRVGGLDVSEWWIRVYPKADAKSVIRAITDVSWCISARLTVSMTFRRLNKLPAEFAPTLSEQSGLRRKHENEGSC